jgi:hypothetical protein
MPNHMVHSVEPMVWIECSEHLGLTLTSSRKTGRRLGSLLTKLVLTSISMNLVLFDLAQVAFEGCDQFLYHYSVPVARLRQRI